MADDLDIKILGTNNEDEKNGKLSTLFKVSSRGCLELSAEDEASSSVDYATKKTTPISITITYRSNKNSRNTVMERTEIFGQRFNTNG